VLCFLFIKLVDDLIIKAVCSGKVKVAREVVNEHKE
jgi:hypothetical protein